MRAAGCGSIQDGFILAADILASGNFITVGTIPAPCSAFLAAVQNLQNDAADPEAREILIYSLASNAAVLASWRARVSKEPCGRVLSRASCSSGVSPFPALGFCKLSLLPRGSSRLGTPRGPSISRYGSPGSLNSLHALRECLDCRHRRVPSWRSSQIQKAALIKDRHTE